VKVAVGSEQCVDNSVDPNGTASQLSRAVAKQQMLMDYCWLHLRTEVN